MSPRRLLLILAFGGAAAVGWCVSHAKNLLRDSNDPRTIEANISVAADCAWCRTFRICLFLSLAIVLPHETGAEKLAMEAIAARLRSIDTKVDHIDNGVTHIESEMGNVKQETSTDPRKELANRGVMDVAPAPTQTQLRTAEEIAQTISKVLSKSGVVHPETAVMSAARIAGTFLFRDFKFATENIAPGTTVLSDNANNAAPLVFNTLAATLRVLGVATDPKKRTHFPGLGHQLSVTDTQKLLEAPLRATAAKFDLNSREAAQSCAIAAGRLIQINASSLDPSIGSPWHHMDS